MRNERESLPSAQMPLGRSILWILLCTLCISGSALMAWLYFLHKRELRLKDEQYRIAAIVQSPLQTDRLKSVYLAELLGLSLDRAKNLHQFNTKTAVETLVRHPVIVSASVKKILPGTLFIEYKMRTPVAFVGDFSNTLVDETGVLFPFRPFFTPKNLPTLFLGLDPSEGKWGEAIACLPLLERSIAIMKQFECLFSHEFKMQKLDLSRVNEESYGRREIIATVQKEGESRVIILRLSTRHTDQDLVNFRSLYEALQSKKHLPDPLILDFRIPHLGFFPSGV